MLFVAKFLFGKNNIHSLCVTEQTWDTITRHSCGRKHKVQCNLCERDKNARLLSSSSLGMTATRASRRTCALFIFDGTQLPNKCLLVVCVACVEMCGGSRLSVFSPKCIIINRMNSSKRTIKLALQYFTLTWLHK
jgi:hypothetical protein